MFSVLRLHLHRIVTRSDASLLQPKYRDLIWFLFAANQQPVFHTAAPNRRMTFNHICLPMQPANPVSR